MSGTGCVAGAEEDSEDIGGDASEAIIFLPDEVNPTESYPNGVVICKYTVRNDSCYLQVLNIPDGKIHSDIRGFSRRVYVGSNVVARVCSGENFGGTCRTLQPGFYQDGVDGFSRHIKSVSVSAGIGVLQQE